ncbi:DNA-binding transcriptional regulator, LysR family [Persephonella hydrogeniphila]|uniref:DNA-binding transcriptional regulator, LysR family n=1 Tax=Persephonella hydrogeniphila TaxID=198703 RepID=A0A285NCA2_9AQUI|nr:LysR family transcriptional regulator [Persephonella hydrogeniphila]SNZ06567.1 DNA-binding transcriptional regulator, LysR family [Persephonella hydrogeniphila]
MEVLDYHKLKIFKTVADTRSFSKAAELLFLSQPTVTLQIKKIENYLGITLFRRDKKGVILTEEGKILYEYASKILDDYNLLEEGLSNLRENLQKSLRIGASTTIGDFLLPDILPSFLKDKEGVKVNLFVGNSKEIEEGILSKTFYIGLIEDEVHSNKYEQFEFFSDEIILIASKNTDIPDVVAPKDLQNYRFVFREQGSGTRNIVEKRLEKEGVKIKADMEISSSKAIARLVANSDYLSFVSRLVVKNLLGIHLKEVKIKGIKFTRKFYCITQKNIRLPKIDREFVNYLINIEK